jgi:hypothetical protein
MAQLKIFLGLFWGFLGSLMGIKPKFLTTTIGVGSTFGQLLKNDYFGSKKA